MGSRQLLSASHYSSISLSPLLFDCQPPVLWSSHCGPSLCSVLKGSKARHFNNTHINNRYILNANSEKGSWTGGGGVTQSCSICGLTLAPVNKLLEAHCFSLGSLYTSSHCQVALCFNHSSCIHNVNVSIYLFIVFIGKICMMFTFCPSNAWF